jgi:hypothetical protein
MAYFLRHPDNYPLEEQVKSLGDEELLDFWEESQFLEVYIEDEQEVSNKFVRYEEVILKELHIRNYARSFGQQLVAVRSGPLP